MQGDLDKQKELVKQELFDKLSLEEVLELYSETSSMIKSLEDREKELAESENNGWWIKENDCWR